MVVSSYPDTYYVKITNGSYVSLSTTPCTFDEARELAKTANAVALALVDDFDDIKYHYVR